MAYTLTFADSVDCQIDDQYLSSPYILNNGDSIQVYSTAGDTLTINGTEYKLSKSSAETQSIDISDTDINITVNTFPPAVSGKYLTINFSAAEAAETPKALSFRGKILKSPSGKILYSGHSAPATKLATPQNITVDGTAASWDEVENATSYELFADGTSIGELAVPTGYTVTVSWSDDYSLWSSLQYSTDSGTSWTAMPGYEARSGGNATITGVEGKIRFKVAGNGGTCAIWKDGTSTGNTITLDGQSPDYTLTANTSFELIGSD